MKIGPRFRLENPDIVAALLEALKNGATAELACKAAGISKDTLYVALRKGRDGDPRWIAFVEAWDKADAHSAIQSLKVIRNAAVARGEWTAAAWLMERRHGYRKEEKVEHAGKIDTGPALDLSKLSDDELAQLEAITAKAGRKSGDEDDDGGGSP